MYAYVRRQGRHRFHGLIVAAALACAISATTNAQEFAWVPVGAVSTDGGAVVGYSGGTVTCPDEPTTISLMCGYEYLIEFELRMAGWGAAPGWPTLGCYQVMLDSTGFADCPLYPYVYPPPSGHNAFEGCFQALRICHEFDVGSMTFEPCPGAFCNIWGPGDPACPPTGCVTCMDNPYFVFTGILAMKGVSTHDPNYGWYACTNAGQCKTDPGCPSMYGGTLKLVAPTTARGTCTFGFDPASSSTFMNNCGGAPITGIVLTPASVEFVSGACCWGSGASVTCTSYECEPDCPDPGRNFYLGEVCLEDGGTFECPSCWIDVDCYDGDACTDDTCILPAQECQNVLNYDPVTECCDSVTGSTCLIDDGDVCTDDLCDPVGGYPCVHDPAGAAGWPCDDQYYCTHTDVCDGVNSYASGGCGGTDIYTEPCVVDGDCVFPPPNEGPYCCVGGFCDCDCWVDCQPNGIWDECDIDCGPPGGVCDIPGCGESDDCNSNETPDECDIADGTSSDVNSNDIPDECEPEAEVRLVVRLVESGIASTETLPLSDAGVTTADEFVVELWATDGGDANTGLVGVFVDLAFDPGLAWGLGIDHDGGLFPFPPGGVDDEEIDNVVGVVTALGGIAFDGENLACVGVEPEWARVAVVAFEAQDTLGAAEFATGFSLLEIGACVEAGEGGAVPAELVRYGTATVDVTCIYNLSGGGLINAGDIWLFGPCLGHCAGDDCWGAPDLCKRADFDCSGCIGAGDIGWFVVGWLKDCDDLSEEDFPPPCPPPGGGSRGASSTGGDTVASGAVTHPDRLGGSVDSGPLANNVLIRWDTVGTRQARARLPKPATVDAGYRAGDQFDVELWARDDTVNSRGLTAVFVDVRFDPSQVAMNHVDHGSTYTSFASGKIGGHSISRLGGASLDAGVAVGAWTQFAVVRMTALVDLPRGPQLEVRPAYDGVAGLGRGTVPDDQIRVIGETQEFSAAD